MYQSTFLNLLLQLSLFSFALAEETLVAATHGNTWQYGAGGGVLGFIVLILDIIVFSKSWVDAGRGMGLMCDCSGGPQVQSPCDAQAALVCCRLLVPYLGAYLLLAFLQPYFAHGIRGL